jgi:hypothetical protein
MEDIQHDGMKNMKYYYHNACWYMLLRDNNKEINPRAGVNVRLEPFSRAGQIGGRDGLKLTT